MVRLNPGINGIGRAEVFAGGEWGTICADGFFSPEARVFCRQMGYADGISLGEGSVGGTGRIVLDDVGCQGNEDSVFDCASRGGLYSHDCTHDQDVDVQCSSLATDEPDLTTAAPASSFPSYTPSTATTSTATMSASLTASPAASPTDEPDLTTAAPASSFPSYTPSTATTSASLTASPAASPTEAGGSNSDRSTSEHESKSGMQMGTLVAIIVGILLCVVLLTMAAFLLGRKGSSDNRAGGQFENPMYEAGSGGAFGGQATFDASGGVSTSGYMDVSHSGGGQSSSGLLSTVGYEDVDAADVGNYEAVGSGSGYMDVNPINGEDEDSEI